MSYDFAWLKYKNKPQEELVSIWKELVDGIKSIVNFNLEYEHLDKFEELQKPYLTKIEDVSIDENTEAILESNQNKELLKNLLCTICLGIVRLPAL